MGFMTQLLAVGPIRPGIARSAHPEGGPQQARDALARFLPDLQVESIGTADVGQGGHPSDDDQVWVSTFGPTTVSGGELEQNGLAGRIGQAVPAGEGWWQLTVHSVVDLCRFEVRAPGDGQDRELSVSGEDSRESAEAQALGDHCRRTTCSEGWENCPVWTTSPARLPARPVDRQRLSRQRPARQRLGRAAAALVATTVRIPGRTRRPILQSGLLRSPHCRRTRPDLGSALSARRHRARAFSRVR